MLMGIATRTQRLTALRWLIDAVAAFYILYSNYHRRQFLSDPHWKINASEHDVRFFLIYSISSWIALAVLELRTCIHFIQLLQRPHQQEVQVTNRLALVYLILLVATCVSSYLTCQYSYTVLESFEKLTPEDGNVFFYFYLAAAAKNLRVVLQGMCTSIVHVSILLCMSVYYTISNTDAFWT